MGERNTKSNGRLDGKSAIVTGAAKGIGAAIATRFAQEGADILINFNSSMKEADELAKRIKEGASGRVISHRADVSKMSEIKSMVANALNTFGKIDVLVNNAGVLIPKDFFQSTEEEFDKVLNTNLKGPFFCSQEVAAVMQKQGGGRIINISSISALAQPTALAFVNYVASKAGVLGLTRALAVNLAPYNIRVNAVCPGLVGTDMTRFMSEERMTLLLGESMVHRVGRPEEIASACVYLASDEADFVTGEFLTVGGGRGMR